MAKTLKFRKKESNSSNSFDKSIHKRNVKSKKIRNDKLVKNDTVLPSSPSSDVPPPPPLPPGSVVLIPYCANQIKELNIKVAASKNEEIDEKISFVLMDFAYENYRYRFKSALKDGANDCFLLENFSFDLNLDVRNMDL